MEFVENEFWEMIYEEYGVADELDILSESITQIITPTRGIIILITKDFNNGQIIYRSFFGEISKIFI